MKKEKCVQAFRSPREKGVQCRVVQQQGGKWCYCGHQYYCRLSGRYEADPGRCGLKGSGNV